MCRNVNRFTIVILLTLTGLCLAEIPLNISGQMQTAVWYTLETGFKSMNFIYLISPLKTKYNPKFNGRFAWKYQSNTLGFDSPFDKLFSPAISSSTIEINGPIYFKLPGYEIAAGNVYFNFSPYIAQNNYDNAEYLRGLTITNLNYAGIKVDGFYGWHATPYEKVGFGLKGQRKINNNTYTCITTGTMEKRDVVGWNYIDRALSYNVNIRHRSGSIDTIIAADLKANNLSWMKKFTTAGRIRRLYQYELELFDFDKEFDPVYRNRQVAYEKSGLFTYYGINPLDKYRDCIGVKTKFSGSVKSTPTVLEYEAYKLKSKDQFLNRVKLKQEHSLNKWDYTTSLDLESRIQKNKERNNTISVEMVAKNGSFSTLVPAIRLSACAKARNLDLEMLFGFSSSLYGLELLGGFARNNCILQKTLRGSVLSPLGLMVSFRISTPNIIEDDLFYYDSNGKPIYSDNYFLIKHAVYF